MKLTLRTNANGEIEKRSSFDPPILRNRKVRLSIEIQSPDGIEVKGTIDIDAVDGDTSNPARPFTARTGQRVDLGVWNIDKDDNRVVVTGKTNPPQPNRDIVVELDHKLV